MYIEQAALISTSAACTYALLESPTNGPDQHDELYLKPQRQKQKDTEQPTGNNPEWDCRYKMSAHKS